MSNPIEKLRLKHFRGASQSSEVTFDTKKSLVMVFGENGTGKSTIADVRTDDSLVDAEQKLTERSKELENIEKEIAALPDVDGEQAVKLIGLLQSAQRLIAEPADPKTCPVCEKPVKAADLRESISTRLNDMPITIRCDHTRGLATCRSRGRCRHLSPWRAFGSKTSNARHGLAGC